MDSIINQSIEDIYQELPDSRKTSSSSSKSSQQSLTRRNAPQVAPRPKKKIAPPPPKPEQIYDDVAESIQSKDQSSSSSSSSSSSRSSSLSSVEVQVRPKKLSREQAVEEARKSFQEAPEQYRKESSYVDAPAQSGDTPKIKTEITAIIETLGEDKRRSSSSSASSVAKEPSSSSSSKSSLNKLEEVHLELSERPSFQRRKSSFSSMSEVETNVDQDVGSFHDKPGVSIDDSTDQVDLGTSDSESSSGSEDSSSDSQGEFVIEEPKEPLVIDVIRKSPVNGLQEIPVDPSQSEESDNENGTLKRTQVINLAGFTSSDHSSDSESEQDQPSLAIQKHSTSSSSQSSIEPQRPQLSHASEAIDDGFEIQMCTPVVIRSDDSSSDLESIKIVEDPRKLSTVPEKAEEVYEEIKERKNSTSSSSSSSSKSSSSSSSSSKASKEQVYENTNGINPVFTLPNLAPKPTLNKQRATKSLDMTSTRLQRKSSSSSTSSSRSSKKSKKSIDGNLKKKVSLKRSDLTDSFLKNLNKRYEPVYSVRKVNSMTQTETGTKSQSLDQW